MSGCEIYRAFAMANAVEVWKSLYCQGNYTACERYKLAEAHEVVPSLLLPSGKLLRKASNG